MEEAAMKAMANILWQGRRIGGSGGNKEKEEPVAAGQEGGGVGKSDMTEDEEGVEEEMVSVKVKVMMRLWQQWQ